MARWSMRGRAFFKGLWDRRKQGVTALLMLLAYLPEWLGRRVFMSVLSKLLHLDGFVSITPALLHSHGVERLLFIVQVLAALALLHILRKAAARAEAQLLIGYLIALSIFYSLPALTSGAPVPVAMVTGNPLREAAFGVMSCSLIGLCQLYGTISRRAAMFISAVLFVLQILVVMSIVDDQLLNIAFSALGMWAAGVFSFAIRHRVSKPAVWLFRIYATSLVLRPFISGLSDVPMLGSFAEAHATLIHTLTVTYYLAMLAKLPALIELARTASRDVTNEDDPPAPPHDDWPMYFRQHSAS